MFEDVTILSRNLSPISLKCNWKRVSRVQRVEREGRRETKEENNENNTYKSSDVQKEPPKARGLVNQIPLILTSN
jgi:hypothetical protein